MIDTFESKENRNATKKGNMGCACIPLGWWRLKRSAIGILNVNWARTRFSDKKGFGLAHHETDTCSDTRQG